MWEGLLNATGGALGPDKTKWWAIHYKWAHNEWRYATEADLPGALYVNDPLCIQTQLERLAPDAALRTLRVRIAPNGNMQAEKAYLKKKAADWVSKITSGCLP